MNVPTQLRTTTPRLLILLFLTCFGLLHSAQAVSPPPDGGYPGGNTAEGQTALFSLTSGSYNTAIGLYSLMNNTTGNFNTGVGAGTLLTNTGSENTAIGAGALLSNTTGNQNTATGESALFYNTTGNNNTATGVQGLVNNTTGNDNTAAGASALSSNTTGGNNTAIGRSALQNNTTGNDNTANGFQALLRNTTGNRNTAIGISALLNNTTGRSNTALGRSALQKNTTGEFNIALGSVALFFNTTGNQNTAIGGIALQNNTTGFSNTANGFQALLSNTTGTDNIALGANAGLNLTTGISNIDIGNTGVAGESNTIRIGMEQTRTFIKGISGAVVSGAAVVVDAGGQLGVAASSARFKDEIKPMDKASEAILALKPVTFRYKKEIDPAGTQQFGLVAEDVEKINPDLVVRDRNGQVNSVRYELVNAMLLNEFLKQHKKVEEQQATITRLESDAAKQDATISELKEGMRVLTTQLKDQAAQIQKVSAQVELSQPAKNFVDTSQ